MDNLVQYIISSLSLGGLYALMTLGLVVVYGILRLINFAYGELVMVAGYGLLLFGQTAMPWPLVALLSIAVAILVAVLMERVAFRPVRFGSASTMLITSFAVSTLLQNTTLLAISPRPQAVRLPAFFVESVTVGGLRLRVVDLASLAVSILALIVLSILLRRTIIGIALRAAADDFTMTRLLGVRANLIISVAFAVSGLLAGIVAIFWVGRSSLVEPAIGLQPVLIAFIASVVGGMENLKGAVLGGYLLGFLTVGLQTWLPQALLDYRNAILFGIVIVILLLRPEGLIRPAYSRERR
ncbi:MAG: branched-chain amino acid ABC transporter permease [Chloroflexi bacterium]|nr:branched-chain amino acid ABC transporter permease [Chloroflexota bacterium]